MANHATTAATEVASLGMGPTMLPVTELPTHAKRAYSSGPDMQRDVGRIVAYAVKVRADCKVGEREFSAEINMHEVVILRRFYEEMGGGSVQINPSWPQALRRLVPLDQQALQNELNRMSVGFIVPKQQGTMDILGIYLGNQPTERLKKLHEVMSKQVEAWNALVETADKRVEAKLRSSDPIVQFATACEHITGRELEGVANIADPGFSGNDAIELPAALELPTPSLSLANAPEPAKAGPSLEDLERQAAAEDAPQGKTEALTLKLQAQAAVDMRQAMEIATLVDMVGDPGNIPDDDIIRILGSKAKLAGVKKALKG